MPLHPVTVIGQEGPGGHYLLRIQVSKDVFVRFGQYRLGGVVEVSAGEYVYTGSAQGLKGSTTLASRLLRHTSTSDPGIISRTAAISGIGGIAVGKEIPPLAYRLLVRPSSS